MDEEGVSDADVAQMYLQLAKIPNLEKRIADYARRIEELLLENQSLRESMLREQNGGLPCVDVDVTRKRKIAKTRIETSDGQSSASGHVKVSVDKAKPKPTVPLSKVFQVIDTKAIAVRNTLLNGGCKDFSVSQAGVKAPVKIKTSPEHAELVRGTLKKHKASYHEFKLANERCSCFIIKGLVGALESDLPEIKNELVSKGLPANISVSLYTTSRMRADAKGPVVALVKLILPPMTDVNLLVPIKSLMYVAVKFEAFNYKNIIQCHNCQRFGHTSSGCSHPHRCVKCGEGHLRADCPRTNNKEYLLKCCNCNGAHTANNLAECQFFISRFRRKSVPATTSTISSEATSNAVASKAKFIRAGVSFAEVTNVNKKGNVSVSAADGLPIKDLAAKIDCMYGLLLKHDKLLSMLLNADNV